MKVIAFLKKQQMYPGHQLLMNWARTLDNQEIILKSYRDATSSKNTRNGGSSESTIVYQYL